MSIYRGPYFSASGCDGSARPGTRSAMSWYLGAYEDRGAANLGTYACKRLGKGWSIHAERRAADMGTAPYGGVDSAWGWALANALRLHSAELGVQLLILGDRIWSCTQPDAGWRPYGGAWHGHLHAEFIPSAADNLTAEHIERTLNEEEGSRTLSWDQRLTVPGWFEDHFPGNFEQGEATARLFQTAGYGYSRLTYDQTRELLAGQAAILARLEGKDETETREVVRQELDRHWDRLLPLLDGVPEAVAAELGDRDSQAVREAVERVLSRVRVRTEDPDDG